MTDDRQRAGAYLDRHPDATGPELLGALLLDPTDESNRELVAEFVGGGGGDADETVQQTRIMADGGREHCSTLGCENPPTAGGEYCEECASISPGLLDDPETVGDAVNPAGRSTDSPDTSRENPVEGGTEHPEGGCEAREPDRRDGDDWRACFAAAMQYFNRQVDRAIPDHADDGEHPDRPDTAREYYNARGWDDETIDEYLLGYAPADRELLDHLRAKGYDRDTILATGLFTVFDDGSLSQLWAGRYVLPYFDADGHPVYAISRATGAVGGGKVGYDGNPRDFISGKYGKLAHSKEYVEADEPIFGLDSVREGEPLLVAGGIADAITLQQAGYSCISPVTTVRFKRDHEEQVVELVEEYDVPAVYLVNDAERATVEERETDGTPETITDALTIEQHGEGLRGAFGDADFLLDAGIDTRLVTLPRAGRSLRKVDPDDYVHGGWGDLDTVLAAAKPAEQHPGYDRDKRALTAAASGLERERERSGIGDAESDHSALFDLDVRDVTGRRWGSRGVNPLGHHGESENYYVMVEEHGVGYDHKYRAAYNALTHLLVAAGERRAENPNGALNDAEVFAAWEQAKRDGLLPDDDPIPHRALRHVALSRGLCDPADVEDGWKLPADAYNGAIDAVRDDHGLEPGRSHISSGESDAGEPVAVLPELAPRARAAANGWDWRNADTETTDDALTVEDARERTREAVADAYRSSDRVLIEALPTLGKSYSAVAAAADADEPVTVLTGRGNREQYEQYQQWCEEHGLRAKVLPSVWRDCETFAGEYGAGVAETVKEWYNRGATGKDIHIHYEDETGEPIPCDGPAGARCSYKAGWQFDAENYDVLIGHYNHAHVNSVTKSRTVVFDEFTRDDFETTLDGRLAGAVTRFLKQHRAADALPSDYADLMDARTDTARRADALAWFADHDPDRDGTLAFDPSGEGHAIAPLAAFTLLAAAENDLSNGWERAELPDGRGIGLFDREEGRVHLLRPPDLRYARGVVALDGTPTPTLWRLITGERLNHRPVLTDAERVEYIRETLGLNLVRTTDAVKPYSGTTGYVADEQDAALLDAITEEHGRAPALLTTLTAERSHENAGLYETDGGGVLVDGNGRVDELANYGDLKGSNRFKNTRLGAVIGSRSFGDGFVKKWGAFAGEAVERGDGRGVDLEYSGIGDDVHRHMTHHETLQAVMRFGRDGGGATVYVHTNTLPEWVPLAGEGRVLRTRSDGERQVLDALDAAGWDEWTTSDLAEHPAVEVTESQARRHLHRLADDGYLSVSVEGNGFVWRDDGLHRVGEHGEVELAPLEWDELTDEESDCIARSTIYTWDAITSPASPPGESAGDDGGGDHAGRAVPDGGEPPTHNR